MPHIDDALLSVGCALFNESKVVMERRADICVPNKINNDQIEREIEIDWHKCLICQKDGGPLRNPRNNPTADDVSAQVIYNQLAVNIIKLADINQLPVRMDIKKLKNGVELGKNLFEQTAVYHKSCRKMFDNDKVKRAEKRNAVLTTSTCDAGDEQPVQKQSRRLSVLVEKVDLCFFCNEGSKDGKPLHKVTTFKLDSRVRRAAKDTNNTLLYSKLQNGDMCAQDALYHSECICKLYRDAHKARFGTETSEKERKLHGLAFSKVISFIDEQMYSTEEIIPVFKLADLTNYYSKCLEELGIKNHYVHRTRLKNRIKEEYEDMVEETVGRDVILAFKGDIGDIISNATHADFDNEGLVLAEASKILRRDILQMENTYFNGTFDVECQERSIPQSLKLLMGSILHGNHTSNPHYHQAMLTIGQLIRFNTLIRTRSSSTSMYHTKDREPPVTIYLSELIHAKTRDLGIVDKCAHLGFCISEERLFQLSTSLGNSAVDTFERDGAVVPLYLEKYIFCTTAVDNIDHNPSSATANDSFHGTAASVNQHPVLDPGVKRTPVPMSYDNPRLKKLSDDYTEITPFQLPGSVCPPLPAEVTEIIPSDTDLHADNEWLENSEKSSWAAFHAQREEHLNKFKEDRSALLPIWRDDSKSPATIKHVLEQLEKTVQHLNPGQPIVTTLDQPLYAIAKKLQWYLEKFGATKFVFVLGSLHTEMAMVSTLGDWLKESGWLQILAAAKVTGTGNQALLTGKQVSKSKYCHQVTAFVLHSLLKDAYDEAVQNGEANNDDISVWRGKMENLFPQFQYWSICLKMEMSLFLFVRSIRSRNFLLYKKSIKDLLTWMFALDHFHYARWLSVHSLDMDTLENTNNYVYKEFEENGNFVVARTKNRFSSMGIDQRHEQLNAEVKGAGGAIGLTESEEKFLRWMLCAPEEARMVREFEEISVLRRSESDIYRHHEQS